MAQVREKHVEGFQQGEYLRDEGFKNHPWCGKGRVDKGGHEIGGKEQIWVHFLFCFVLVSIRSTMPGLQKCSNVIVESIIADFYVQLVVCFLGHSKWLNLDTLSEVRCEMR